MVAYSFGQRSLNHLDTVDPDLARVAKMALSWGIIDMTVIEGRRSKAKQDEYFAAGKSRVLWPHGKHNVERPGDLAAALDIAPYVNGKVSWNWKHCLFMAGVMMATAALMGVKLRWGGNWDMDGEPVTDQEFQDLVHFELVK